MKKGIGIMAVLGLLSVVLAVGCMTTGTTGTGNGTEATKAAAVVKQLPGVIDALANLAMTVPVDGETKARIETYAATAKTAAEAVSTATATDGDALTRLAGVVDGLSKIVADSSADSGTKGQVKNYVAWAGFALRAAALLGAMG